MERLNGGRGLGAKVQCRTCAWAVVIFSNAIGHDLGVQWLGNEKWDVNPDHTIPTKKIRLIGQKGLTETSWVFHVVGWDKSEREINASSVYDACLALYAEPPPNNLPKDGIPVDYPFHIADPSGVCDSYRELLVPKGEYSRMRPISDPIENNSSKEEREMGYYQQGIRVVKEFSKYQEP